VHERLASARQHLADRSHREGLLLDACLQVGEVVAESKVDHPVSLLGAGTNAVEVGEIASKRRPARAGDGPRRGVGSGEAEDLVASSDEIGGDG
jgi:hypothetical protein